MSRHYHQGKYTPENPEKYAGNPNEIYFRSGWELQVMIRLDRSPSVVLWNSEGLAIPYRSPLDGRIHRYFPDMTVKVKDKAGQVKVYLFEIKPHAQTQLRVPKKKTKKYLTEVATYAVNRAKWDAAEEFCKDQGWEFQVLTEKDNSFA